MVLAEGGDLFADLPNVLLGRGVVKAVSAFLYDGVQIHVFGEGVDVATVAGGIPQNT